MSQYFSGQGSVFAGLRNASGQTPGGFVNLGNCSSLLLHLGRNFVRDATGGSETLQPLVRATDPPTFDLVMEELTAANLALLTYGQNTPVSGATVSGEVLTGVAGASVPLANINLTAFTSLTNAGGGTTYVRNVDYLINLSSGMITIPSGSPATGSLRANYIYGAHTKVGLGTIAPPYYWLRFEGLNSANFNTPVVVDLFSTRLAPVESLPLIGDTFLTMQIQGRMFKDSFQNVSDLTTGQLMRIRQV
jgi:hypothetical protein